MLVDLVVASSKRVGQLPRPTVECVWKLMLFMLRISEVILDT